MEIQKLKKNIILAVTYVGALSVLPATICLGYHLTNGNISGLRPSTHLECAAPSELEVKCSKVPTNESVVVESPVYRR
jgi:hypothetical protein